MCEIITLISSSGLDSLSSVYTETDLGLGWDFSTTNPKRQRLFAEGNVRTEKQTRTDPYYKIITSEEEALEIISASGTASLSYKVISGSVTGSFLKEAKTSDQSISVILQEVGTCKVSCYIAHKEHIDSHAAQCKDVEQFRQCYGTHYISKIIYGSVASCSMVLKYSSQDDCKEIAGKLKGKIGIGPIALEIEAEMRMKEASKSSNLTVESRMFTMGYKRTNKAITSFSECIEAIKSHEVDETSLVPVAIEVSPIPVSCVDILSLSSWNLSAFTDKIKSQSTVLLMVSRSISLAEDKIAVINSLYQKDELRYYPLKKLSAKLGEAIKMLEQMRDSLLTHMSLSVQKILRSMPPIDREGLQKALYNIVYPLIGRGVIKEPEYGYVGHLLDDKPCFTGREQYNGSTYVGEFLSDSGKRYGYGILSYSKGKSDIKEINGEWVEGIAKGHASISFWDGSKYEGEVDDCKPHGKGKMKFPDGDDLERESYDGLWRNGKRHGNGTLRYKNGNYITSVWRDNEVDSHTEIMGKDGLKKVVYEDGKIKILV